MAPITDEQLLTVADAAAYLSVSVSTVRRWVRRDEIEHVRLGRAVRIRRTVLERFVRERTRLPTDYAGLI